MSISRFSFFCCLLGVISCGEKTASNQDQSLESFRGEVAATPVHISQAEQKTFDYLINASGKVESSEQVIVVAERSGYLTELSIKEGDFVNKGAVIARMDQHESLIKLERAGIQQKNANATYRSEMLSFENLIRSEDSLRGAEILDQLKAKSGLLTAEIELKEAKMDLEKTQIKAAISGKVADVKAKKGSLINAGDPLFEIINVSQLELKVKVLESDINLISIGQKAEIYAVGGNTEAVEGRVKSINPKVDENGLVQVGISVLNTKALLPGMNARAIIRAPQNNSIVVPKQAVVYRSGRPVVFTIESGESKWNYVEVGKDNGQEIEVLNGVEPGQTVITSNNLQLAHQAPVQIIKE